MTSCSNEVVLWTVVIRDRAVCAVHSALDLYAHLKSLEVHAEEGEEEQGTGSAIRFLISAVFCMQDPPC